MHIRTDREIEASRRRINMVAQNIETPWGPSEEGLILDEAIIMVSTASMAAFA